MGCVLAGKDSLWGEDVQVKAEVFSDFFFLFMQKLTLIWERVSWVTSLHVTWIDLPLFPPSPRKCPARRGMTA